MNTTGNENIGNSAVSGQKWREDAAEEAVANHIKQLWREYGPDEEMLTEEKQRQRVHHGIIPAQDCQDGRGTPAVRLTDTVSKVEELERRSGEEIGHDESGDDGWVVARLADVTCADVDGRQVVRVALPV